jgi:hypothetical protein
MHRNHSSDSRTPNPQNTSPLGTTTGFNSTHGRQNPTMYDCAGRSFIMPLNTRDLQQLWKQAFTHQPWSDNPLLKTRTSFPPHHSHDKTSTGTRIQTHQNLFTLTKNISALNIEAGSIHPVSFPTDLCRNRKSRKPKLDFPINDLPTSHRAIDQKINRQSAASSQHQNGGDGRNRTDDPLLAKQVLYQLSYIPKFMGKQNLGGPGRT